MGTYGDITVTEPLIEMAQRDPSVDPRREAVKALARFADDRRVVDALIGALADESLSVAHAARQSLTRLSGVDLGMDPEKWKEYWE
jgi:HEAT repeat protein